MAAAPSTGVDRDARAYPDTSVHRLVLVELFRLLIIYLRDHHVSVDVMVEVTLVGTLLRFGDLRAGTAPKRVPP